MILLAFMAMAAVQAEALPAPRPSTNASTWFDKNDYPSAAIRTGEEGAVKFALDVSATGAVTGCRIVESSGFADLDAQTCASAMIHARFDPAVDAHGKAVAGTYVRRMRWTLPGGARPVVDGGHPFEMSGDALEMSSAMADVQVDADGRVTQCRRVRVYLTTVDPCQAFAIGDAVVSPAGKKGSVAPGTLHVMMLIGVRLLN